MFRQLIPWWIGDFFRKLFLLICAGVICVSCSLFMSPPSGDSDSPDDKEKEVPKPPLPCDPVSKAAITMLQFEETPSQEKIQFIDELSELDDKKFQQCLQAVTKKEVIVLTISDLSRHTNSDVAEKAKVLMQQFNMVSYVEEGINSEDEERQKDIVKFLLRIEEEQAKKVLEEASFEEEISSKVQGEVSGGIRRVLIPTESEQGDRYYIQASWDPANLEQISCLTALFNEELQGERTLEQEEQKMKELNGTRRAYWYSKEWALGMAESIEGCGAKASFVSGSEASSSATDQTTASDLEDKVAAQSEKASSDKGAAIQPEKASPDKGTATQTTETAPKESTSAEGSGSQPQGGAASQPQSGEAVSGKESAAQTEASEEAASGQGQSDVQKKAASGPAVKEGASSAEVNVTVTTEVKDGDQPSEGNPDDSQPSQKEEDDG